MSLEDALFDTAPPRAAETPSTLRRWKAMAQAAASSALLPTLQRLAADRVGGCTLEAAWPAAARLKAQGVGYTLGYWDGPGEAPADIADLYLATIARVGAEGGGYVSIKPPALRFDAAAAARLGTAAKQAHVRLHCDSHGVNVADLTFAFADELLRHLPPELVSVTVPGRWTRSAADAPALSARGVGVRLVKGQWPDPADPHRDLREGVLEVARALPVGAPGRVAIATHDAGLLREVGAALRARAFEVEMIHGLETPRLMGIAGDIGAPVSVYVPYGPGFVPSALRVLRQNPRLLLAMLGRALRR